VWNEVYPKEPGKGAGGLWEFLAEVERISRDKWMKLVGAYLVGSRAKRRLFGG